MALLDYFLRKKEKQVTTASKAKERLQIKKGAYSLREYAPFSFYFTIK